MAAKGRKEELRWAHEQGQDAERMRVLGILKRIAENPRTTVTQKEVLSLVEKAVMTR